MQTQEIVQQYLMNLTQRNLDKITELFSDNVDWYIPGDINKAAWLGKRSSKQEIKDFYSLLWENTEPVSAQIERMVIDNDYAVITGEFSTKMLQTGNIVDSLFCIQITVKDNLIIKYRLLEDSYAVSISLSK